MSKNNGNKGDKKNNARVRQIIISSLENAVSITKACESAEVSRKTFYEWCHKDPDFKAKVYAAKESRIAVAEDQLFKNVMEGSQKAIEFYLCNRAKLRWQNVNKVEVGVDRNIPIFFNNTAPTNGNRIKDAIGNSDIQEGQ